MRIAVVGTGISGLSAGWLLARRHEVHLFEGQPRAGGHSHTVVVSEEGNHYPLDVGFMVFNHATYPRLTRLFELLEVATRPSEMSFSVSCRHCDLEYSGGSLSGLLAQPWNLVRPSFLALLRDIPRFNRRAHELLADPGAPELTVGQFLATSGLCRELGDHYLLPMAAAIWSAGSGTVADFPLLSFLRFSSNHGLLGVTTHHQWHTVAGGSRSYVAAMTARFGERLHLAAPVRAVSRDGAGSRLHFDDGGSDIFDHVVVATHADQALQLLADPSDDERDLLGAWRYSTNAAVLHRDPSLLPRRAGAVASWNVLVPDCRHPGERVQVTYHLNRLQGHESRDPFLLTLNPDPEPPVGTVAARFPFTHPIMDRASLATQANLPRLNGPLHRSFCGAYFGWGFHEDGLAAGIRVAEALGESFP